MNDHLTTQLTRSLTDHSDAMAGAHLGLAEVKGRARSIRRRRQATAVVGAAAAVALLVPTVALAGHTGGSPEPAPAVIGTPTPTPPSTPLPTAPPNSTSTPMPTPPATQRTSQGPHGPAREVLDVSGLPTGDAPQIEYVTGGRTLHRVDASSVDVPTRYRVRSFVTLSDGSHLWLTAHGATPYVEVQDGDGNLHDPVRSGWDLGTNSTHSIGSWVRPDGQVMVWNSGATQAQEYGDPVPGGNDLRMGPVLGDRCGSGGFCEVYVNVPAESGWQPWEVSGNGTAPYRDGSYLILADSTESGLSIGATKITDFGSCSRLLGGGEFQGFATCKNQFSGFSPDGQLLLGEPPYYDGLGPGAIAMYDLHGKRLFERAATAKVQSYYAAPAVWEDDTHALAAVSQDGRWAIVRFASDGSMEYAVPPVVGDMDHNPFVLATS